MGAVLCAAPHAIASLPRTAHCVRLCLRHPRPPAPNFAAPLTTRPALFQEPSLLCGLTLAHASHACCLSALQMSAQCMELKVQHVVLSVRCVVLRVGCTVLEIALHGSGGALHNAEDTAPCIEGAAPYKCVLTRAQ